MSEYMDVPVAEVAAGDECRVDGIGEMGGKALNLAGHYWNAVAAIGEREIVLGACEIPTLPGAGYRFRRSSIVAVRRRKPEPPKPGDWRCEDPTTQIYFDAGHYPTSNRAGSRCPACRVYRASGGWSRDTRDGQPWVMREFEQASATVPIVMGSICYSLRKLADDISQGPAIASGEPLADYYKRIGLDVRPADRRGKR